MLDSLDPLSSLLFSDFSVNIDFLPVVGILAAPLPEFETYVVSKDTSSVIWIYEWNKRNNRSNTITRRYGEQQQISSGQ
jgi:hypothetical protein